MSKKPTVKKQLTATNLRVILSVILCLILIMMAVGFYLAHSALQNVAQEVSEVQTRANESDERLQQLGALRDKLDKHKTTIDKASRIVAESTKYRYQDQIIDDLSHYAHVSGVGIQSFSFSASDVAAPSASGDAPASDSNSSPQENTEESTEATPATPVETGPKSTSVSIQLSDSVKYENLLRFIKLIENNITRMQIANLQISKDTGEDKTGLVFVQTLTIEVYIK